MGTLRVCPSRCSLSLQHSRCLCLEHLKMLPPRRPLTFLSKLPVIQRKWQMVLLAKKTTMKIIDLGDGRIASHTTIEGHPEMNSCCVTKEGIDNHVNVPHLGGKCVVTYNKHGNGFKSVIKTEKMGTWNMEEEITEEGIKAVTTINGQSFTECWKRVVNITGLYKYKCGNGIVEYMKKAGYPDAIAANIEDYKMAIKACDTGLKVWESWGEVTATFSCTFDQETTYKMPFKGAPEAKVVVTHNGPGKYSWVVKAAGAAEEWKIHACDDGMKLCARNLNTGDACTSELYKEKLPIMGKWKTASVSGCKELYKLMGMPDAEAQKHADEIVELEVDEKGPIVRWNWKSKLTPMDLSFKWNEETDIFDPVLKETTKNVATKNGNVMDIITHSSMGVWHCKITVGHTFMVNKCGLIGMEPMTYIMMRQKM